MTTEAQLPTEKQAEEAYAFLATEVHAPAFFEKLATYNIVPRTQAEATQLLELGAVLGQRAADGTYKTAAATADETANPFLTHALSVLNDGAPQAPAADNDRISKTAAQLVRDNAVARNAALIFSHVANGGVLEKATAA